MHHAMAPPMHTETRGLRQPLSLAMYTTYSVPDVETDRAVFHGALGMKSIMRTSGLATYRTDLKTRAGCKSSR